MTPAPRRDRLSLVAAVGCGLLALAAPLSGQEPGRATLPACSAPSAPRVDGVVVDRATRVPLPGASVASLIGGVERRIPVNAEGRFRICDVSAETRLELRAAGHFPAFSVEQQRSRSDCRAVLIWCGDGRVRQQRQKPESRCADERRAELTCTSEEGR